MTTAKSGWLLGTSPAIIGASTAKQGKISMRYAKRAKGQIDPVIQIAIAQPATRNSPRITTTKSATYALTRYRIARSAIISTVRNAATVSTIKPHPLT